MRTLILGLLVLMPLATACNDNGDGGDDEGTNSTDDSDDVDPYNGCHPLIAEYLIEQGLDPLNAQENSLCFTLNTTEPCTRRGGREGTRVYRFLDDGRVDAEGNFSGTERWFWFGGDQDEWDEDAVDLLSYSGSTSFNYTGSQLSCVGCEELYEVTREVVENNTGTRYSTEVLFALDNLNPNGGWQGGEEERNMFVFYGRPGRDGEIDDLDTEYAKGQYTPDSMVPGELPAGYTWGPQGPGGKCY